MPIDTACVGAPWEPLDIVCDTDWVSAYTRAVGSPAVDRAHAVFPVAPEWALLTSTGHRMPTSMTRDEVGRGVHAAHDLVHHRPLVPGESIRLTPRVRGVDRVRAGARTVVEIAATDTAGQPVWTTRMTNIHLGVEVVGPDRPFATEPTPPWPDDADVRRVEREVAADAAHVYSDLGRIWNPIHTDREVARRSGLPDVVLHGTATLAMAVDAVCRLADAGSGDVRRLACRFSGMVPMPSRLVIEVCSQHGRWLWRVVCGGSAVVRDGVIDLV